jgi:hypothetical protein
MTKSLEIPDNHSVFIRVISSMFARIVEGFTARHYKNAANKTHGQMRRGS